MAFSDFVYRWVFGYNSPSKKMAKTAKMCFVKPFNKALKQGNKALKKYKAIRNKFEKKWLKQNESWNDTRQKKKAMQKAFLEEHPQYSFYIQLERLARKCKK